jgi:cytochrome c-type biogenesis protein
VAAGLLCGERCVAPLSDFPAAVTARAALAVEPFAAFLARFRAYLGHMEKVMGGLLVLTGLAFLFGVFTQLNNWLIELFPALATIG